MTFELVGREREGGTGPYAYHSLNMVVEKLIPFIWQKLTLRTLYKNLNYSGITNTKNQRLVMTIEI